MAFTLALNTNPLVNRFAEPEDLIDAIAHKMKIRDVQLTHEFINPSWPAATTRRLTRQMRAAMARFSSTPPFAVCDLGRLEIRGRADGIDVVGIAVPVAAVA